MGRSLASLDDRYRLEDGEVLLSGVQALARGATAAPAAHCGLHFFLAAAARRSRRRAS